MCAVERSHSLPLSRSDPPPQQQPRREGSLRRRLSYLSLRIQPAMISSSNSWRLIPMMRSKSLSSIREHAGSSLIKWWDWGRSWLKKKKPSSDLEMMDVDGDDQSALLGAHGQPQMGSPPAMSSRWRHLYYKVRSEMRKLTGSNNRAGLPQTCRYTSFDYAKNFDDGNAWDQR